MAIELGPIRVRCDVCQRCVALPQRGDGRIDPYERYEGPRGHVALQVRVALPRGWSFQGHVARCDRHQRAAVRQLVEADDPAAPEGVEVAAAAR